MGKQAPSTHCRVGNRSLRQHVLLLLLSRSKEYGLTTNAGVMRFLQLEWHNHERARNAWDIERAEMKAKIAKQEGEVRSAKKLNDQLNKHIRMLEQALLNERARSKAAAAGGGTHTVIERAQESRGKLGSRMDSKGAVKPAKRAYNLPCRCSVMHNANLCRI
jgi:hypothetical protein